MQQIYILCVLVITVVVLVYYYVLEADHKHELEKVNKLESQHKRAQHDLEVARSRTTPCTSGNFTDPRSCYVDSGYACSWNDLTKRCDQKA